MRKYILNRTLKLVPTILGIIIVMFFIYTAMPGTYVDSIQPSPNMTQKDLDEISRHYNLDSSQIEKFGSWMKKFFEGKLEMYQMNVKQDPIYITPMVLNLAKDNIEFIFLIILVGILIAVPIGANYVLINKEKSNLLLNCITWICTSIPSFLIASASIGIFYSSKLFANYLAHHSMAESDNFTRIVLGKIVPFVALSIIYIPRLIGTVKTAMKDISRKEYIATANAYGIPSIKIKYKYALKNAFIPIVTFIGMSFSSLFSESIIIQSVTHNGGLGSFLFSSVLQRQYDVMMACLFTIIIVVVISNYLADIAYLVDPRIRKSLDNN